MTENILTMQPMKLPQPISVTPEMMGVGRSN